MVIDYQIIFHTDPLEVQNQVKAMLAPGMLGESWQPLGPMQCHVRHSQPMYGPDYRLLETVNQLEYSQGMALVVPNPPEERP